MRVKYLHGAEEQRCFGRLTRRRGLRQSLVLYYEDIDLAGRGCSGWRHCIVQRSSHHHAQSRHHRYSATTPNEIDFLSPLEMSFTRCTRSGWRTPALCSRTRPTKRPLTLRMPSRPEPAHRRRVLGAILKRLPGALKSRRTDRTSVARTTIASTWERRKW